MKGKIRSLQLALDEPDLSPRELAVRFTDAQGYFVSVASVYRLLKAHNRITSPTIVDYYNQQRYHESVGNLTPPTSTSGAAISSNWKGRKSNGRPSNCGAFSTANMPPRMTNQMRQSPSSFRPALSQII